MEEEEEEKKKKNEEENTEALQSCIHGGASSAGGGGQGGHVLLVAAGVQGHMNPMFYFAQRMKLLFEAAASYATPLLTLVITEDAKEQILQSNPGISECGIGLETFSNGLPPEYDSSPMATTNIEFKNECMRREGSRTLRELIIRLRTQGRPVTCVVYDSFLYWVPAVAADQGLPAAFFWTQSCAALLVYLHASRLGLRSGNDVSLELIQAYNAHCSATRLSSHELISFMLPGDPLNKALDHILQQVPPPENVRWVLCTSIQDLEHHDMARIHQLLPSPAPPILTVGPLLPSSQNNNGGIDMRKATDCTKWLDSMEAGTVIYISYGSMVSLPTRQIHEIVTALHDCARPFLWVLRPSQDNQATAGEEEEGCKSQDLLTTAALDNKGRVVPWAPQTQVLAHPALGAFVSHCGWNSTIEGLSHGVPMLCAPHWSDQFMNAALVSRVWGTGLVLQKDSDGIVPAAELVKCWALVLDKDSEEGVRIRGNAQKMKEAAAAAMAEEGSSHANICRFWSEVAALSVPNN